eukprot:6851834-Pyramimonas_sp.AAC.1
MPLSCIRPRLLGGPRRRGWMHFEITVQNAPLEVQGVAASVPSGFPTSGSLQGLMESSSHDFFPLEEAPEVKSGSL